MWSPRWSRDGRYILALQRELSRVFAPRGLNIYFLGTPPESQEGIFRVRLSDSKLELVLGLENVRQATSSSWGPGLLRDAAWGAWKGLAPDDSPLLLRDAGTQEIYAFDVAMTCE